MQETVVHLIAGLGLGGAERQLLYVVRNLSGDNVRHVVISMTDKGALGDAFEGSGVDVYCLGMIRGRINFGGLFRLRALLKDLDAQVLQTWMYHAGFLGLVVGRLVGVPSIVWNLRCSNMDLGDYGRITGMVVKICAHLSGFVPMAVVNSQAGLRWHEQLGYHPKNWRLIYNGFDLDRFAPNADAKRMVCKSLGIDPGTRLVGLVARYDPMKGHGTFLAAAREVVAAQPDTHFILVGKDVDDSIPALRMAVHTNGLDGRVHMLGARNDISELTAAFDVAVSSSLYGEGFPNTIGEAMACGVPCVVTDVGDSAAIVGDLGWVVPLGDAPALAQAVLTALDLDAGKRVQLSQDIRAHVAALYGLDTMTAAYHDLYAGLIARTQDEKAG